jgi:hypothetical protein
MKITKSTEQETFQSACSYFSTLKSIGFGLHEALDIVFQYTGYLDTDIEETTNSLAWFFDGVVVNPHQIDDKVRSIFSVDCSSIA